MDGFRRRVAHGDGAAVHVHFFVGNREFPLEAHHHGGEGLVHFKQVNLVGGHARFFQRFARRRRRTGEHDGWIGAGDGCGNDAGAWCQAHGLALGFAADQHGGGAVDNTGGVTGVMNVVDLLNVVVLLPCDTVEAHFTHHLKGGFEATQALQRRVAAHMLVTVEDHDTVLIRDGNNGFCKVAVLPCIGGFLLGFHRKAIDIFTAEAFKRGYQVRADTLGHETGMQVGFRVRGPGSAVPPNRSVLSWRPG